MFHELSNKSKDLSSIDSQDFERLHRRNISSTIQDLSLGNFFYNRRHVLPVSFLLAVLFIHLILQLLKPLLSLIIDNLVLIFEEFAYFQFPYFTKDFLEAIDEVFSLQKDDRSKPIRLVDPIPFFYLRYFYNFFHL